MVVYGTQDTKTESYTTAFSFYLTKGTVALFGLIDTYVEVIAHLPNFYL